MIEDIGTYYCLMPVPRFRGSMANDLDTPRERTKMVSICEFCLRQLGRRDEVTGVA